MKPKESLDSLTKAHYPAKCGSDLRRGAAESSAMKTLRDSLQTDQTTCIWNKRKKKKPRREKTEWLAKNPYASD